MACRRGTGSALVALVFLLGCGGIAAELPLVPRADDGAMAAILQPDELLAYRLSRQCEDGDAGACQRLGGLYFVGRGVPRIAAHAVSLWTHACGAGDGVGCVEVARLHERGEFVEQSPAAALDLYEQACRNGRASACSEVGAYLREGRAGAPKRRRGVRWFRRGCTEGDPRGCHELALEQLAGEAVRTDVDGAVELLATTCDGGYGPACTQLAVLFEQGTYVRADLERAGTLRIQACEAGEGPICTALGLAVLESAPGTAVEHFDAGCSSGDPQGCAWLGHAYAHGQGVAADPEQAFEYYAMACRDRVGEACGRAMAIAHTGGIDAVRLRELYRVSCNDGDPHACHYLAGVLVDGVGGPADPQMAARLYEQSCAESVAASCVEFAFMARATENAQPFSWLERACRLDHLACAVLGEIHEGGYWAPAQPDRARPYYEQACDDGSARACLRLGTMHYRGSGTPRDDVEAARLFVIACEGNEAEACATLGHMHDKGLGVPRDPVHADRLRERACELEEGPWCASGAKKTED